PAISAAVRRSSSMTSTLVMPILHSERAVDIILLSAVHGDAPVATRRRTSSERGVQRRARGRLPAPGRQVSTGFAAASRAPVQASSPHRPRASAAEKDLLLAPTATDRYWQRAVAGAASYRGAVGPTPECPQDIGTSMVKLQRFGSASKRLRFQG